LTPLLLSVGQLPAVLRLQHTAVAEKNPACYDKLANFAFREQSEEFELTQPRSVHAVKFDDSSPVSFVPQTHTLARKGLIGQVCGYG
jgi:hypothetical protein